MYPEGKSRVNNMKPRLGNTFNLTGVFYNVF